MTRPRFKNPVMQQMYEVCRVEATRQIGRVLDRRHAYWAGFNGEPARYLRTSFAYAAWAAGRDNERAGR